MTGSRARLPALTLLAALPFPVPAHLVSSGLGPFYDGALHVLLSPEDLLGLVAIGLLAGQGGKASSRWAVTLLPLAWGAASLAGYGLAAGPGVGWPKVAMLTLLGVVLAVGIRPAAPLMASLAILTGALFGLDSAVAMAAAGVVGIAGNALAVLVPVLLASALAASLRAGWPRLAVRVAGSWIASVGVLMIGWMLHGVA